jgi:hypothetical protein
LEGNIDGDFKAIASPRHLAHIFREATMFIV